MTQSAMDEIALVPTVHDGTPSNPRIDEPVHVVTSRTDSRKARLAKKYQKTPLAFYQALALGALLLILILVCVAVETWRNTSRVSDGTKPHSQDDETYHLTIVDEINSKIGITWKARYNKFASRAEAPTTGTGTDADTARLILKKFFNLDDKQLLQDTVTHIEDLWKMKLTIPKSFDIRTAWPQCWAVHQIFNQAGCGSCWSVAATSVMSDRVCINTNGSVQTQISALDLTSCCLSCGGCQGTHWALSAFTYWKEHGIVSGGAFGTHEGCRPYTFEPSCGTPCGSSLYRKERTPRCERQCQSLYHKTYDQDLVQARKAYWLRAINGSSEYTPVVKNTLQKLVNGRHYERFGDADADKISEQLYLMFMLEEITNSKITELLQRELMSYGPVLACFTLYEDFQHYTSGIYKTDETRSLQLYGHCAKLMGWGEERGVKYWLYANTWGRDWGEHGFFRIDMSEIPEEVVAGVM